MLSNVKAIVANKNVPDLTLRDLAVLTVISQVGEHTVGSIATELNLAKPNVTRINAKLEDLGFLQRQPHPGDKRLKSLFRSTSAGRKYLTRLAA